MGDRVAPSRQALWTRARARELLPTLKERKLPKAIRWGALKAADGGRLTEKQQQVLTKLKTGGFATAIP
ncbi:hypothetical protein DFAR_1070001 [Desulfarculales bacterium]